jgi:hypothetical protein
VMATCRVLVYATTGYVITGAPDNQLWLGALLLFAYLIALSAIAKREVARELGFLVARLIAGIALLDATFAVLTGHYELASLCVLFWLATLAGQRYVPGT